MVDLSKELETEIEITCQHQVTNPSNYAEKIACLAKFENLGEALEHLKKEHNITISQWDIVPFLNNALRIKG